MRILVFGASGMIGSAMFRVLSRKDEWSVFGTVRSKETVRFFSPHSAPNLLTNIDVDKPDALVRVFAQVKPDVVINCIGLTKHHKESDDPLLAIPLNALLPHRIAELCSVAGARLIHISTDCVFSGNKGAYTEEDAADAQDVYGKAKLLGEVRYSHAVTLRTSTIGHELQSAYGLLEWFLSQAGQCRGFNRAIFSGLPNTVFAEVVRDYVIPRPDISGLYHVGASSISKCELLKLIGAAYGQSVQIVPDNEFVIDRSLNSERFHKETGYLAPAWPELIQSMHTQR